MVNHVAKLILFQEGRPVFFTEKTPKQTTKTKQNPNPPPPPQTNKLKNPRTNKFKKIHNNPRVKLYPTDKEKIFFFEIQYIMYTLNAVL